MMWRGPRRCLGQSSPEIDPSRQVSDQVTFGDRLDVRAPYGMELGELPSDYDPSKRKDTT